MKQLPMHKNIEPFGKDISIMEMDEIGTEKKLPFYADGFAGIIYSTRTFTAGIIVKVAPKSSGPDYLHGFTGKPWDLKRCL